MSEFTKFTEKMKTAGSSASAKAKEVSGAIKLRSEINNVKKEQENLFLQLGKIVYKNQEALSEKDPGYANLIDAITYFGSIMDGKIAVLNEIQEGIKIEDERSVPSDDEMLCPNCGKVIPKGKNFCMFCGCDLRK